MQCFVLVGGESRRMGAPKADLVLGNRSFVEIVCAAAAAAFDEVVAVQRPGGKDIAGVKTIREDEHDDRAAIFGVERALAAAAGDCFILALDYPLVTGGLLRRMRSAFESSRALIVAARTGGVIQPLCGGYRPPTRDVIRQRIAQRRYDLRSLVEMMEVVDVSGDDLLNVNTPEDLMEARKIHEQRLLASR